MFEDNTYKFARDIIDDALREALIKENIDCSNYLNGITNDYIVDFWEQLKSELNIPGFSKKKWKGNRLYFRFCDLHCYIEALNTPPKNQQLPQVVTFIEKNKPVKVLNISSYIIKFNTGTSLADIKRSQIQRIQKKIENTEFFFLDEKYIQDDNVHSFFTDECQKLYYYALSKLDNPSKVENIDTLINGTNTNNLFNIKNVGISADGEYVIFFYKYFFIKSRRVPKNDNQDVLLTFLNTGNNRISSFDTYAEPRALLEKVIIDNNIKIKTPKLNFSGLCSKSKNAELVIVSNKYPSAPSRVIHVNTDLYSSIYTFNEQVIIPIQKAISDIDLAEESRLDKLRNKQRNLYCCYLGQYILNLIEETHFYSLGDITDIVTRQIYEKISLTFIPFDTLKEYIANIAICLKAYKLIKKDSNGYYTVQELLCSKDTYDIYDTASDKINNSEVFNDYEADREIKKVLNNPQIYSAKEILKILELIPYTYKLFKYEEFKIFITNTAFSKYLIPYLDMYTDVKCDETIDYYLICNCIGKKPTRKNLKITTITNVNTRKDNNQEVV